MRPELKLIFPITPTPRDIAMQVCPPTEKDLQELTLYLEIKRAEKRYTAQIRRHG